MGISLEAESYRITNTNQATECIRGKNYTFPWSFKGISKEFTIEPPTRCRFWPCLWSPVPSPWSYKRRFLSLLTSQMKIFKFQQFITTKWVSWGLILSWRFKKCDDEDLILWVLFLTRLITLLTSFWWIINGYLFILPSIIDWLVISSVGKAPTQNKGHGDKMLELKF